MRSIGFYGDRNNNEVAMGLEKKMSRRFEVDTGIKVDPLDNPQPEDRLPIARNAIRSGKYDAVMIDIVWAGELAPDLVDLKPFFEESEIEQHSQEIINNNTIGGALVAIPWFQEIGLLYYRNDLLERDNEKFDTWEALEEAATRIQEKEKSKMPDFNGFAWQGSDHEGLTCNALEWIASWGGLDTNTGKILFNNEGVLEALDRARKWVNGERAISRDAKGFEEEGSLQMFLHGKAAFLRSWTSAYAKLKQARIPFEVAPLPRGKSDRSFGVVGGWQLAVPKKSPNKPSAIEFIRYLSSPGVQRWRAREGAYQPTMQKLDEELDVANALPRVNMKDIQPIIRPSSQLGDRYDEVSKCIYNSVRAALDSKSRDEIKQYIVNMKNCVESNEPPKVDR